MKKLSQLPPVDFRMVHLVAGGLIIAAVAWISQTDSQPMAADDAVGKPQEGALGHPPRIRGHGRNVSIAW